MTQPAPSPIRPGFLTAAGGALLVFGAVQGLIGVLFVVLGVVFSNADTLPDWVLTDPTGGAGVPRLLLIGTGVMVYAVIQMLTAVAVLRGSRPWAQLAGIAFALVGAGLCMWAMLPRSDAPSVNVVFLPLVVAFGLIALALAMGGAWLRGEAADVDQEMLDPMGR
jgi:hypothetical protein